MDTVTVMVMVMQGIMQLDGELQQLHDLLNNNSAMVAALKSVAAPANTSSRCAPRALASTIQ